VRLAGSQAETLLLDRLLVLFGIGQTRASGYIKMDRERVPK
jgi:hypothetical protein